MAGARQTAVFSNPLRVRVLMACAAEELNLSELRRRTEAPLAKLHYHVSRLLAAELLTVSRTQRRAGRGVRFYRAVSDSFIVPQEKLSSPPGERLSAQLRQALTDEQGRRGAASVLYTPAPGGGVIAKLLPREVVGASRGLELWRVINLTARQRASLAEDLSAIFARYGDTEGEPGADPYLVHAAFAPHRSTT